MFRNPYKYFFIVIKANSSSLLYRFFQFKVVTTNGNGNDAISAALSSTPSTSPLNVRSVVLALYDGEFWL